MYCEKCGKELLPDALFCAGCGNRIMPESAFESTMESNLNNSPYASDVVLSGVIRKQNGMDAIEACSFAFRINHEYPIPYRKAAYEIAEGKEPALAVAGRTCSGVAKLTGIAMFDALEVLRIMEQDLVAGMRIIQLLAPTDTIRR